MDIEKFKTISERYGVIYSPTFLFLRNGTNLRIMATTDVNKFETDLNLYRNELSLNNN